LCSGEFLGSWDKKVALLWKAKETVVFAKG
jgi:hypothetical protein